MQCNENVLREACSISAFFNCGPVGFEVFCMSECSGEASDDDLVSAALCTVCNIATCCSVGGTPEDCVFGSLPLPTDDFVVSIIEGGDVADLLPNLVGELLGNTSIPQFCPAGTCDVDGFCECFTGDLTQCSENVLREACSRSAFFNCGPEGFEDFCSTNCIGQEGDDLANTVLCTVCNVATCCSEGGAPQDCVYGSLDDLVGILPLAGESVSSSATYPTSEGEADSSNPSGSPVTPSLPSDTDPLVSQRAEETSSGASSAHLLFHFALASLVMTIVAIF